MARRRTRRKSPSRRSKTFNVASALEAGLIANAVTQGFFNADLGTFIMSTDGGGASTSATGRSTITAREILSGITGGGFGTTTTMKMGGGTTGVRPYNQIVGNNFGVQVRENLAANGAAMVGQLILIPAGFKVFNTLTRKPRSMANKALKMTGLPLKV